MQVIELTGSAITGLGDAHQLAKAAMLPTTVCLGRVKPRASAQCLQLDNYVGPKSLKMAAMPASYNWGTKAAASIARVYVNDQLGCCVWSGKFHHMGVWAANDNDSGGEVFATDQEVRSQYLAYTGGRDVGSNIEEVLNIFRNRGLVANGKTYKIDGFMGVDWQKKELVKAAIYALGGVTIGFDLPGSWSNSAIWDVTSSGIVGGHDVLLFGYDDIGCFVASWGRIYKMTWAAVMSTRWIDQMFALLAPLWYNADQLSPLNFNVAALQADLAKIGSGVVPDFEPPAPPVPMPTGPHQMTINGVLPAGPFTITSGGIMIQGNASSTKAAGTYFLPKVDPLPPG